MGADKLHRNTTLFALLTGVVAVMIITLQARYFQGSSRVTNNYNTQEKITIDSAVAKCVSLCKEVTVTGEKIDDGICLSPDVMGYGCAVVANGKGHCVRFFRGAPEIVLNNKCEYVGVYTYAK